MTDRHFYKVPPGRWHQVCQGPTCRRVFYWIRENGRAIPVDCDVPGGQRPSETADSSQGHLFDASPVHEGWGIHHMHVCPDAERFAKNRSAAP